MGKIEKFGRPVGGRSARVNKKSLDIDIKILDMISKHKDGLTGRNIIDLLVIKFAIREGNISSFTKRIGSRISKLCKKGKIEHTGDRRNYIYKIKKYNYVNKD